MSAGLVGTKLVTLSRAMRAAAWPIRRKRTRAHLRRGAGLSRDSLVFRVSRFRRATIERVTNVPWTRIAKLYPSPGVKRNFLLRVPPLIYTPSDTCLFHEQKRTRPFVPNIFELPPMIFQLGYVSRVRNAVHFLEQLAREDGANGARKITRPEP